MQQKARVWVRHGDWGSILGSSERSTFAGVSRTPGGSCDLPEQTKRPREPSVGCATTRLTPYLTMRSAISSVGVIQIESGAKGSQ